METPKEKLKKMTAWDVAPTLGDGEIDELLAQSALVDANGLAPLNEEWTPTYDLNTAASSGWLIKAARAAATVDEPTAGAASSKLFDNCRSMARLYRAKGNLSLIMTPSGQ